MTSKNVFIALTKRFRVCFQRTEIAESPFPRARKPHASTRRSRAWLAPTRVRRPRASSRERDARAANSRGLTYRNRGHEFEREQERAALFAGFREHRSQNREQRDEREGHAPKPRGDDAVVPDEVHGSRDGRGFSLRHHERRVEPSARAAVCGKTRRAQLANETNIRVGFRIFRGYRLRASALSTAHMPPALEVYHVPPEGRGPGKFVARLEAVGASGPDEDGEPSDAVYVAYELDSLKRIVLFHTWTPSALRGKGLAARVCEEAFAWAEANDVRVVPECSYVSDTFLAKRKDLERLVDR